MDDLAVEILNVPEVSEETGDVRWLVFKINGRPLADQLPHRDLAGLSVQELPPNEHLLGRPPQNMSIGGRAALLVCPLCGDLACGAVLARITAGERTVVWDDFVFANTWAPQWDEPIDARFEFDRERYEGELRRAASEAGR
jgi:hypothetical protein